MFVGCVSKVDRVRKAVQLSESGEEREDRAFTVSRGTGQKESQITQQSLGYGSEKVLDQIHEDRMKCSGKSDGRVPN